MAGRTWLITLPAEACVQRLEQATIGRLGVVVDGRPQVFPVGYLYADDRIHIVTDQGTKLHGALDWPSVGFEIDGLSPDGSSAWSVMVSGRAELQSDPAVIQRVSERFPVLFRDPAAKALRWIAIVPSEMSGRLITMTGDDGEITIDLGP